MSLKRWTGLLQFHPVVRTLLVGTAFTSFIQSMAVPFLAIYLARYTDMSLIAMGLALGASALCQTFGGFFGGAISDYIGRQRVMFGALLTEALVYVGFTQTVNPWVLTLLLMIGGFCGAFFGPASRALMGDLTDSSTRLKAFALRYLAVNVGYGLGPLLGVCLGVAGRTFPFVLLAGTDVLYLLWLVLVLKKYGVGVRQKEVERMSVRRSLGVLRLDRALLFVIIGGILTTVVNGRWSTPMSQYLTMKFAHGATLFSLLLTVNSLVVVVLQPLGTKWTTKHRPFTGVIVGCLLFSLGEIGFAASTTWGMFVLSMAVFTVGEILVIPSEYMMIDEITPDGLRGTYYGAASFTGLGNFVGPLLCNSLLSLFGGSLMFSVMAVVSLLSLVFYRMGQRPSSVVREGLGGAPVAH